MPSALIAAARQIKNWLRERGEWLVVCFAVWFLDIFEQRKEEKERQKK
jgi:hypothetical protein